MSELTQSMSFIAPCGRAIVEASSNRPRLLALRSSGRRSTNVTAVETPRCDVVDERLTIRGGPSGEVHIRVVRPVGSHRDLPTIVYHVDPFGCSSCDAVTHGRLICELALVVNAAVFLPASSLSSEPKRPISVEERGAVCRWAAGRGLVVAVDGSRLARMTDTARAIDAIRAALNGDPDPTPSLPSYGERSVDDVPRAA